MDCCPSSRIDYPNQALTASYSFGACVLGAIGVFVLLALLTACGSSTLHPPPPPSLSAVPSSLTFNTTTAQTFLVSGGTGTVTPSNNCTNIATLTAPQSGAVGTWSVTPALATGSCTATFTDTSNAAATVAIAVQLGLAASPNTLNFTTSTAQTFSVTGGSGTTTLSDTCAGIATLTPPSSGVDGTWTVTPSANGMCAVTFTDSNSSTAQVTININLSSGTNLSVSPTSLSFSSTASQTFSVIGGTGPITELDDCSGIATVKGPTSGIDGTWIVTPTNATGSCTASFVDSTNAQATETITVNISNPTSTLVWQMELDSSCATAAYLKFFDETANLQWPGQNLFYVLNQPGQIQSFALACTTGDKICFGASLYQNSDQYYWGVGVLNDQSCTSCCYACSNATVNPGRLTGAGCSDARSKKTGQQRSSGKTAWEKNMDLR